MFRLYSTANRFRMETNWKDMMQKLQERLLHFGAKQIGFLARLVVIVHNDLVQMFRVLVGLLIKARNAITSLARDIVQANPLNRLPLFKRAQTDVDVRQAAAEPELQDVEVTQTTRTTKMPEKQCIYAIGDIHGRCDLLIKLLDQIDADATTVPDDTEITIVFLGDYIDRGLQSRQVIDLLLSDRLKNYQTVFLMGNHEEALLRFLEDSSFGSQWSQYGGAETLFSYGLQPPRGRAGFDPDAWHEVWDQFRMSLPPAHLEFFQSMQHYFTQGDYLFVHAGLRPNVPLEEQSATDMLWIRDDFLEDTSTFPQLIVHGHTPEPGPFLDNRRMGLDTAAYNSGILTAAKFIGTDIEVLMT